MAPPSFSSTHPTHLLFPMTRLATLSLALYHYLALFVGLQTKTTFCLFAYSETCISLPLMYPAVIHIFVSVARLMVCCRYDSPPQTPHCCPSGCCGGGTFLPLPSLEKAISGKASVPCVTALDVQMESPGRITLPASSFAVWLGLHHLQTVHHLVSCQREHPVLLFCLILIHDGSNSRVVRQHLG